MTVPDAYATQREVDQLREDVRAVNARLTSIDEHGTRGVIHLQSQIGEVIKDVTEMKVGVDKRFDDHAKDHAQAQKERVAGRRWLIGTGLAGLVAMSAVISLLVDLVHRIH